MQDERDQRWLWRGTGVLAQRRRKSAAVIAAVARVIEAERPAGTVGIRLLEAVQQFEAFSPATKEWLAGEPYAYFWGRLAYELLRSVLRPDSPPTGLARHYCRSRGLAPREALTRHLEEFVRLPLAAAVLEGRDLMLERPLVVDPPFALPGTPSTLEGPERLVIHGARDGGLEAARMSGEGGRGGRIAASLYPVLEHRGGRFRLQPAVFNVPVSGIPEDVWLVDAGFQTSRASRVERALALLQELDDENYQQIREGLRVIALRPEGRPGELVNVSHCDLPGAISMPASAQPYELVNILWHEFLHNRLFALEEDGLFLSSPGRGGTETRLYSPWRSDPRPPHGLLHAVYVFTGVGQYWLKVVRADETPQCVRALARSRLLMSLYQVRLGLALLRRDVELTTRGRELLQSLEAGHESLWESATKAGVRPDLPHATFRPGTDPDIEVHPQTVRDRARGHLRRFGRADEVEYLGPLLAR